MKTYCLKIHIIKTKLVPWLPPVIYGVVSIICGYTCLYVPETLNRPLPNSVEDVLKWSRDLTPEEWKIVKENTKFNCEKLCQNKTHPLEKEEI